MIPPTHYLTGFLQKSTGGLRLEKQAVFFIKHIPVYGDLILSPMDGLSERPFRSLVRKIGSAMSYTEFINALDVISNSNHFERKTLYHEFERPVVFQIFDDDADRLVKAARILMRYEPDIIDLNLGCSARHVAGRGAGAALLLHPKKIAHIMSNLVRHLPVPVTAKIRLGWDEQHRNYLEISKILQDSGAQLIAVHGRTKAQGYTGQADWDAIAEIKASLQIPIIANGDVRTVADIERIKFHTRCDAVMIGRAALENPWIFSRRDREQVSIIELEHWIRDHLNEMIEFHGDMEGLILFRKYLKRLLSPYPVPENMLKNLLTANDLETYYRNLDLLFKHLEENILKIPDS